MTPAQQTAYHEGRLAAVREQRDGGSSCPYRHAQKKKSAWHRGLNQGRAEISDRKHEARVAAVPEADRTANKATMTDAISRWLKKGGAA